MHHPPVVRAGYAEFMLRASELMPGGGPAFPTARNSEALYADLEGLFSRVAGRLRAATRGEDAGVGGASCSRSARAGG